MVDINNTIDTYTKSLEKELGIKNAQLNNLMLLTEAINRNVPSLELYQLFRQMLETMFNLKDIVLLHRNEKTVTAYKEMEISFDPAPYIEEIERYDYTQKAENTQLFADHGYDKIIKVYHKEDPLAYLLFKGEINSSETYSFVKTVTNLIAVAIENKRLFRDNIEREKYEKELELARQVQQLLVPSIFPESPEITFATTYIPHNVVSGDYYDLISLDEERVMFCIADVAGKGIPAALLMANLQASLRRLAINFRSIDQLIKQLNSIVYNNTRGERFITMFLAVYNNITDELTYINAGHNPPVISIRGQKEKLLRQGCTVMGILSEIKSINKETVKIDNDAILVMYTDGVTERENDRGEYYGEKRVLNFVAKNCHLEPNDFNKALITELNGFADNDLSRDDITIFSCSIDPEGIQ